MNSKYAICTLSIGGEANDFERYSLPVFKKYAQKIGADFIVFDKKKVNYIETKHINSIKFEKFQVYDLLSEGNYDRVAFFDIDILITPHAPNIFDEVPYKAIGGVFEDIGSIKKDRRQIIHEVQNHFGELKGNDGLPWRKGFLNSGVFVVSKIHKDIFKMIWEYGVWDDPVHKYEQSNTQWYIRKFCNDANDPEIQLINMDYKWNFTGQMRVFHGPFRLESFVIHYAGGGLFSGPSRITQMKDDYQQLYGE